MRLRLALTLGAAVLALAGCGDAVSTTWRPVPTYGVWTTDEPRLLLTELAEDGYDPGGSCWMPYAVSVSVSHRVIHLRQTMGIRTGGDASFSCTDQAVGGVYLRIGLSVPYAGQRVVDDTTGKRVPVAGTLRLAGLPYPPVASGE